VKHNLKEVLNYRDRNLDPHRHINITDHEYRKMKSPSMTDLHTHCTIFPHLQCKQLHRVVDFNLARIVLTAF